MQAHLFPASLDDNSDGESQASSVENQAGDDDADDNRDGVVPTRFKATQLVVALAVWATQRSDPDSNVAIGQ
jgi:hypothetical protein